MALSVGASLGPYRIVERLGAGGMGEVYKAHDTRLNRTVAIKVLADALTNDPVARRRFEHEARAVAALSSPHICPLHDIGHHAGTDFLVMEFLEGETLGNRLSRGRLPLEQAIPFDADEVGRLWPEELPGGRAILFTTTGRGDTEPFKISIHSSDRPGHRDLLDAGRSARYSPSGHLLYTVANSLMAVPFDTRALRVTGKPVPILENVAGMRNAGNGFFSVSESGTLVYGPGPEITPPPVTPLWIGANGVETPLTNVPPGTNLSDPHPSSTGEQVLFMGATASRTDLCLHDIVRGGWTRLTTTAPPDFAPVWASDPKRVIYSSNGRSDAYDLFAIAPDRSAGPQLVFESPYNKFPSSWSATTKRLAYVELPTRTNSDIWLLDLSGPAKPSVFANDPRFREGGPDFSPDGRWLAYDSDESGRIEVFVRPVGRSGKKLPVSTQGGMRPRWSRDGAQLFYINNDTLMVTRILSAGDELRAGDTSVRARFPYSGGAVANYAIMPDGRVLRLRREPTEVVVDRLVVVQDWVSQLLKRSDSP